MEKFSFEKASNFKSMAHSQEYVIATKSEQDCVGITLNFKKTRARAKKEQGCELNKT